ncbi:thiol:disulfide interchange protein DsbG [Kluyvera sp. NPDC087067]|uniref:thiol:disulfide interchange protein DsbG n=1 Tax=unclassified Kluyvera TaxID=2619995 RepID=UPI0037FF16BF
MKRILLSALLMTPVLAYAQDTIPDIVKRFSDRQNITNLKPVQAPGGMKSWVGQYQDMGVNLFLTPDGQHVISGYLYDDKGKNLSEGYFTEQIYIPLGREMWQTLNKTKALKEGADTAPRKVFVFADPFCPYCKTFWSAAQPWVAAGKVQLNTLMVAFLNPKSGRNATAILNAPDPVSAWREYELSGGKKLPRFDGATPRETFNLLQHHQQLMDSLGANATPAIYYMNDRNELQQVVGMPDEKQLIEMFGPRP